MDRTIDSDQHHVPRLPALLQPAAKYQHSPSIPPKMLNVAKENHRTVYRTETNFKFPISAGTSASSALASSDLLMANPSLLSPHFPTPFGSAHQELPSQNPSFQKLQIGSLGILPQTRFVWLEKSWNLFFV